MNQIDEEHKKLIDEMIKFPERFVQIEYGNLLSSDNYCFEVICNQQYISIAEEANSKEGWVKIVIYDPFNPKVIKSFTSNYPLLTVENGELVIARTKLYGDVKIFKTNKITNLPIRV